MQSFKQHRTQKIQEAIAYNVEHGTPLSECVFRRESQMFYEYFSYLRDNQATLEIDDFGMTLIESDLGKHAMFEGEFVPLDLPFIVEEKDVELNKPKRGGPKKFYVYVRNPKTGGVKKVAFGDAGGASDGSTLKSKINDPEARKAYAARHNCAQAKDRTQANYWSCNLPRYAKALGLSGGGNFYW